MVRRVVASVALRTAIAVSALGASFAYGPHCDAADLELPIPFSAEQTSPASHPNSILMFAGRMSTTNIYNTMLFTLNENGGGPRYDNYIVGAAYDRDLVDLGHGFYFGVEVGIADRYGNYKQCCLPIVSSSSIVQSAELWAGPQIRYAGILLFDVVRIGGGVTFGLSAATASIGAEAQRELQFSGNALAIVLPRPGTRLLDAAPPEHRIVLKLQHRSGGKTVPVLPTLGNMAGGYNADVAGIRYRF